MTAAGALARLILARYDGKSLTNFERAEVMEAIPPECRFVTSDFLVETPLTIHRLLANLEDSKHST